MELAEPRRAPVSAERVDVTIADARPVLEQNAELEGRGRRAHELLLVDAQELVEHAHRRHGGFADAHRADLFGFDQRDVEQIAELLRERGGGDPAGGAAACDDDSSDYRLYCKRRLLGCQRLRRLSNIARICRAVSSVIGPSAPPGVLGKVLPPCAEGPNT